MFLCNNNTASSGVMSTGMLIMWLVIMFRYDVFLNDPSAEERAEKTAGNAE